MADDQQAPLVLPQNDCDYLLLLPAGSRVLLLYGRCFARPLVGFPQNGRFARICQWRYLLLGGVADASRAPGERRLSLNRVAGVKTGVRLVEWVR